MRDLIRKPLWRMEDLGRAIPESLHAVSVCLPTWRDHVGYEEQEPRVHESLQGGYPRFVYHRLCSELFEVCRQRFASEDEACQLYPTAAAAGRFCDDFVKKTGETARMVPYGMAGVSVVCYPQQHEGVAKDYWQHSGEGVSSRLAETCLGSITVSPTEPPTEAPANPRAGGSVEDAGAILRERIARLAGVTADCVFLYPCGMAAIYAAYRALNAFLPGRKSVQFGFPYVDTLKIQQKFGPGVHLYPRGSAAELDELKELLTREAVSGLFTELPSNPLLLSPDLRRLSQLAQRHGCPLVVDETVASFVNADLLPIADIVATSLTKFFSGVGDVMGGALVLNPRGSFFSDLSRLLAGQREGGDLLWDPDLAVLEQNSRDFEQRVREINSRAEQLADFLNEQPQIERVYYPKFETPEFYRAFQRPGGGYGGLLSFTLHDEPTCAPRFFDALQICKGPNLGMNYSLACLYTVLAHYNELDFAESCGMSRYLIRVSVGREDADDLINRFQEALAGP